MIDLYFWTTPNGYKVTILLEEFPHLSRWYADVRARPAVQRGLAVLEDALERNRNKPSGAAWDVLFGKGQFERHRPAEGVAATPADQAEQP